MPAHDNFEIDIISALANQLVEKFDQLQATALDQQQIAALPNGQGVYQLFHNGHLVYVGKADRLRGRLGEHRRKIEGRKHLPLTSMTFKCLFIHPNWTALAPERSLIAYYRSTGRQASAWNGNGFGQHDPGRQRETTNKPPDGFDDLFPIREDWPCEWVNAREWNAHELLVSLKTELPFLLRFEPAQVEGTRPHPDYAEARVQVGETGMPACDLLRLVAQELRGWQATVFPSHMILYKENRPYTFGRILWPR